MKNFEEKLRQIASVFTINKIKISDHKDVVEMSNETFLDFVIVAAGQNPMDALKDIMDITLPKQIVLKLEKECKYKYFIIFPSIVVYTEVKKK